MKKSEELHQQAAEEDNDIKAFGILCKSLREKRSEKFSEWLPLLAHRYDVLERPNGSFSIRTEEFGILDYFPKANNLLIRRENTWKKPGLRWIIKNLLKS